VCFNFGGLANVEAQPQTPEAKPRVDLFGDPLPDGAIMRLGTVGFRVPNLAGVGFRPNGDLVGLTEQLELYIWQANNPSKPQVKSLSPKPEHGWRRAISANAQYVAALRSQPSRLVVWDISGEQPVEYLSREVADTYRIAFSPDGKWLAADEYGQPMRAA